MRALIVSDVHANLAALEAALADARKRGGFDVIWSLGDMVGYGPWPGECLDLLRSYPLVAVAGNHDHAALHLRETADFNNAAAVAARWTARQLRPRHRTFLAKLPMVAVVPPFTLVHGSLRSPLREYLLNPEAARATFARLTTRYCLVGHSHIPFRCPENPPENLPENPPENPEEAGFEAFTEDEAFALDNGRWLLNPGSVGQPRDYDPRPSYALYDDGAGSRPGSVARHRVTYNLSATQEKMRQAGLPRPLIDRLNHGV